MNKKKWLLTFGIILILLFQSANGITNSLTGPTGLITIPTAEMSEDGEISFGLNLINKYFVYRSYYNTIIGSITLGYLPFLEITPRLTIPLDIPELRGFGDRIICIRLRPFKENGFFPSIVLGVHDPVGITNQFNASYLVASKSFHLFRTTMDFHLGYGVDWIEAERYQFVGLFGGISLSPKPFIAFMLEHDAEQFNCGMQISVLNHIELLVAFLNFDTFSGGISCKFKL